MKVLKVSEVDRDGQEKSKGAHKPLSALESRRVGCPACQRLPPRGILANFAAATAPDFHPNGGCEGDFGQLPHLRVSRPDLGAVRVKVDRQP